MLVQNKGKGNKSFPPPAKTPASHHGDFYWTRMPVTCVIARMKYKVTLM